MTNGNFTWPENLFYNIDISLIEPVSQNIMDGLDYVLNNTLTERERDVILLRYKEEKTLSEIAAKYGVVIERIRQVESKAIRKLKHPTRVNMILLSKSFIDSRISLLEDIENRRKEQLKLLDMIVHNNEVLKRVLNGSEDQNDLSLARELIKDDEFLNRKISDLDFSVRAYNCLKRGGFRTLKDFVGITEDDLMHVRNLGKRTLEEIIDVLEGYGINVERKSK